MATITFIILLFWIHFVADFVLQSDYVAKNKSKDSYVLYYHCLIYTAPFLVLAYPYSIPPTWYIINGAAHFATDYYTSRASSYLWQKGKVHWFFVVIGFDQAVHMTTLVLTSYYFGLIS